MSDSEGKRPDSGTGDGHDASIPEGASKPPVADAAASASAGAAESPSEPETLRADLEKAQGDAAKYKDQLLRTAADFDNFRKRTRRDIEDAQRKGLERALLELLPVADNLERAVQASQGTSDVAAISEGVRMVLKFHEDALSRLGVERVPSVGTPFDPGLHEAVQHVESSDAPGTVVSELVPGYRLNGKLLRAAMVAVARPRMSQTPTDGQSASNGEGPASGGTGAQEAPQN